jgi:carbamoyltransferase
MKLIVSIGHNSSAIGLDNDGNLVAGYEEERLTRKKSDSSFPRNAIAEVFRYIQPILDNTNEVFISHWFDVFENFGEKTEKYYDKDFIQGLQKFFNFKVHTLNKDFTHHDAHAFSAVSFYNFHKLSYLNQKNPFVIVADGFGNGQEVFSIYKYNEEENKMNFVHKSYGYSKSLGLWYQYATSFLGLKENQDEYKLLGAETYVTSVLNGQRIEILHNYIRNAARSFIKQLETLSSPKFYKSYIDVDELALTKRRYHEYFQRVLDEICCTNPDKLVPQYIIAYLVQSVCESVLAHFVKKYNMKHVILTGGIFYNVKLNNSIMKHVDSICVPPLAGDQGAAIGVYAKLYPGKFDANWKNLFWGKRNLEPYRYEYRKSGTENIFFLPNNETTIDLIVKKLANDEIVNVVYGAMEFGPRALCNTTTFMLPTYENSQVINAANDRFELMPLAPVMLEIIAEHVFGYKSVSKVIGSLEYMIITLDYLKNFTSNQCKEHRGAMHKYPMADEYSGRPQIIKDENHPAYNILNKLWEKGIKMLVNTSFNYHGKPIVCSVTDAINDYRAQLKNVYEKEINKQFNLVVIL